MQKHQCLSEPKFVASLGYRIDRGIQGRFNILNVCATKPYLLLKKISHNFIIIPKYFIILIIFL